ncbi:hypothetical protein EG68_12428 [Paragonimus skrjabini miyazakii]|uniref:Pre-mRNA-splicing factor CWC25 n=1 Tax=Paragonimus skrjabini miyazakii TaxID=59628 RepID=A0A8S9YNH9_9TREM|nr:hypothetical protein EG68_12428 [Paragonimus skrjabini miyazakii]
MNLKNLPSDERAKIASVISKDGKQNDIDWMYNPSKNDSEAYLLGKEVSDADQLQKLGRDYEESASQRLARIDMEAKFRDDPLTAMKQREAEKRMELLRNTAKVKKLRRLITMQKHRQEKKRKQERMAKHKTRSRSRSASVSTSESSSGDELLDKFIKIIRQSDEQERVNKTVNDVSPSGTSSELSREKHKRKSKSPQCNYKPSSSRSVSYNREIQKSKLTQEEMEARRAQMMQDAKEHEKVRSGRTNHHYKAKEQDEKRDLDARGRYGASFISELKNQHAQHSSVEEGVHRKASHRQRGEMNSNFLKR